MNTRRLPPRVLLVEDNADDIELTRRALQRCGRQIDLRVAGDGQAALELLSAQPAECPPDLVLLDLKLPRLGGLDLLTRLRAAPATKAIPVVVLTTSLEEHDLAEAYRRGANSYLRKPVSFEEFTAMVRDLIRYWLDLNQTPPRPGT